MAGLLRKTLFQFASGASNNGVFGTAQLGTKVLSNDPAVIQGISGGAPSAAWSAGWLNATISSQNLPPLEEMQGVQFVHSYQIAYMLARGWPEYDTNTTYNIGDMTRPAGSSQIYQSLINSNLGNTLPSAVSNSNWKYLGDLANLNNNAFSLSKQIFTSSGTYTPTVGMLYCQIEVVGGGASGCAGGASGLRGGGGGGAGACAVGIFTAATIGASKAVTIGAGGAAVTAPGSAVAGNNGASSSVGSLITAGGGIGPAIPTNVTNIDMGAGGAGSSTSTGASYTIPGQGGGAGMYFSIGGGPGGFSGVGGSSAKGGGGVATASSSAANGTNGANGGGGSGAVNGGISGAGGNGIVIITEYF